MQNQEEQTKTAEVTEHKFEDAETTLLTDGSSSVQYDTEEGTQKYLQMPLGTDTVVSLDICNGSVRYVYRLATLGGHKLPMDLSFAYNSAQSGVNQYGIMVGWRCNYCQRATYDSTANTVT